MDIKRHLYQHRKYQYNYVIVELSRTDLGQTFFSIWQNWNRRVFDRLFFPIGKIGVDDFLIEDFQLVKMEQTIFGQTIFNLVNGRVILEERIFIKGPRKLRGDRGNKLTIIIVKKNYIYTHTHTQGVKKRHIWGPVASLNLM